MLGILQQVFKKIKLFSGSVIQFIKKRSRFTGLSNIHTDFLNLIHNLSFLSPVSMSSRTNGVAC